MNKFYKITARTLDEADISIYGDIGESVFGEESVSASNFKKELDGVGNVSILNITINSSGGSVFDGLAIYNMLKRHKAKKNVVIDGLAASAASFIAMAGDTISIPKNAFIMVHRASTLAWGNSEDLLKAVDLLDNIDSQLVDIYAERTKQSKKAIKEMMANETWLNGKEAKDLGFVDKIEEEKKIVAHMSDFFMQKFSNIPKSLIEEKKDKEPTAPSELINIYKLKIKNNLRRLVK